MQFENAKILIAPLSYPYLETECVECLFRLWDYSVHLDTNTKINDIRLPHSFFEAETPGLAHQLACDYFMEKTDCTHLLIIGHDHIFNHTALKILYLTNKDMIAGIATKRVIDLDGYKRPLDTVVHILDDNGQPVMLTEKGLLKKITESNYQPFQVPQVGTGFCLIKREVFKKIKKPYFAEPVDPTIPSKTVGTDIYFCWKVKEAGFEIWIHPDVNAIHIGKGYTGVGLP